MTILFASFTAVHCFKLFFFIFTTINCFKSSVYIFTTVNCFKLFFSYSLPSTVSNQVFTLFNTINCLKLICLYSKPSTILNRFWYHPECGPSWTIYNNVASPNPYSVGSKSLSDCQDVCVENLNCVGIDHNYNDGTCWIHEAATDLVMREVQFLNGNQYVLNTRCAGECLSEKETRNNSTGM